MNNPTSTNVVTQMRDDYMAYSMAVLVGRAIPNLYDGLKPAQRRVLQTMIEENLKPDGRFVKCARVTGLTLAYLHPQGDCYGTLINMATPWTNNVTWINVHGNMGSSVDGPAACRYTECKLRESAVDILLQNKETWETQPNYDGTRREAIRFNVAVPTVLLNGESGIAVGFATRLAPHNLRDVVEATKLACRPNMTEKERLKAESEARELLIPDFPTGCELVRDEALEDYKRTGSGSVRIRAKVEEGVQERSGRAKNRATLTFTNLPPYTNPEKIGAQIKDALEKGKFEGVAEVIDESDLGGDRVTVVAKPGVSASAIRDSLFQHTDLDTKFSTKTLVIDGTKPVELSPLEICQRWFSWRMERMEVQFVHERDQKEGRLEIVMGFLKAIDKIDTVIKIIRASKTVSEAITELVSNRTLKFTPDQAKAILEMRLRQLTNLDKSDLETEKAELESRLSTLSELISDENARAKWIFAKMTEIAKRHGNARRSVLVEGSKFVAPEIRKSGGGSRVVSPAKPRFVAVDRKRGTLTPTKTVKGSLVLERTDKLVIVGENGFFKKVPSTFKGGVFDVATPLLLVKKESEIISRKFLVVFRLEGNIRSFVVDGVDLTKTTSSGKRLVPEGSELLHFGEDGFTVSFVSKRKKPVVLGLDGKPGRPGGKGTRVAGTTEVVG